MGDFSASRSCITVMGGSTFISSFNVCFMYWATSRLNSSNPPSTPKSTSSWMPSMYQLCAIPLSNSIRILRSFVVRCLSAGRADEQWMTEVLIVCILNKKSPLSHTYLTIHIDTQMHTHTICWLVSLHV